MKVFNTARWIPDQLRLPGPGSAHLLAAAQQRSLPELHLHLHQLGGLVRRQDRQPQQRHQAPGRQRGRVLPPHQRPQHSPGRLQKQTRGIKNHFRSTDKETRTAASSGFLSSRLRETSSSFRFWSWTCLFPLTGLNSGQACHQNNHIIVSRKQ